MVLTENKFDLQSKLQSDNENLTEQDYLNNTKKYVRTGAPWVLGGQKSVFLGLWNSARCSILVHVCTLLYVMFFFFFVKNVVFLLLSFVFFPQRVQQHPFVDQ